MLCPVLIGLPGAGKSMLSRQLASALGFSLFSSDRIFRECRAVLAPSDERRDVMRRFLNRVRGDPRYAMLKRDAEYADGQGNCVLIDGGRFRDHGEDLFRLYEAEMLLWHHERGAFLQSVPDLSSSAPLLAENRELFSASRGYFPILLDTPADLIADNLLADYREVLLKRSALASATIRGGFERRFDAVLAGRSLDDPDAEAAVRSEARTLTDNAAAQRLAIFQEYADGIVQVTRGAPLAALVEKIISVAGRASA